MIIDYCPRTRNVNIERYLWLFIAFLPLVIRHGWVGISLDRETCFDYFTPHKPLSKPHIATITTTTPSQPSSFSVIASLSTESNTPRAFQPSNATAQSAPASGARLHDELHENHKYGKYAYENHFADIQKDFSGRKRWRH
jgi:hypothetical protein